MRGRRLRHNDLGPSSFDSQSQATTWTIVQALMTKTSGELSVDAFVQHRSDLVEVARLIVNCPFCAEDIVQDSWMRWDAHSYPATRARPILVRIVKNLAIDWHRRRRRERAGIEAQKLLQHAAPDLEQVVNARQELEIVIEALRELPARTVRAFRMSRVDGLPCVEIGRRLGISESRAYQLVGSALIHVIKRLDR